MPAYQLHLWNSLQMSLLDWLNCISSGEGERGEFPQHIYLPNLEEAATVNL